MGVEKEISSAAALAGGVDVLQSGLSNFESCTNQMNTIFQDFEGRLGRLEGEMLPMKDISAKLTLARRNITSAINKMESINECFLLEKELRGVVQKGMRGNVGAVEYLEEMRRVNEAITYFRQWPSLKSQQEAIRGLEELSHIAAKECIDEFNRLMRTVGPAVQFQTQSNTFESVDTLSDNVAQSLAAIADCLTLLRNDRQLRQNYIAARRFYVDFSTKLVTAERLLWERALKASSEEQDERQGVEAEEAFIMVVAPVIEKLVREVDRRITRNLQELRDRYEGSGVVSGGGGGGSSHIRARAKGSSSSGHAAIKEGDVPADVVVSLLEMSDALHKGSYSLQDILKVSHASSSKGAGSSSAGDRSGRSSTSRGSPPSQTSSTGRGRSNKATEALAGVQRRLSQACLQTFTDLVEAVARDPKQRRNLPDDAAVHPLSSNVLRAVKRIMRFRRGYEELVQNVKMPWDVSGDSSTLQNDAPGDRDSRGSKASSVLIGVSDAAQGCPKFTTLVNHLIKSLFINLTEKSASYPTATLPGAAMRELFLLNNAEYVLGNTKTPFATLSTALNSPGKTPSPTPVERFRSIFGEAGNGDDVGSKSPGKRGRSKSPKRWGLRGGKNKEAVTRAVAARSAAEGLVGPDAGDEELLGLSIADFMTDQMKSLLKRLVDEKHTSYIDTLLIPLVRAAQDDIGELKYQRGKLLTLECGRLLKVKFTSINETWEEVYSSQLTVTVVAPHRRDMLKEEAKRRLLQPYRELYEKYEDVQFSKKHQEQYLKYTPNAIDEGIRQLFAGR